MLRVSSHEGDLLDADERAIRDGENRAGELRRAPGGIGAEKSGEHHQDRHEVGELEGLREPGEQRALGADDFAIAAFVFVVGHRGIV